MILRSRYNVSCRRRTRFSARIDEDERKNRRLSLRTTLTAIDRGWYNDAGRHTPSNLNYLVGSTLGNPNVQHAEVHNFFIFDLASVGGPITSATLRLWNPLDDPSTTDLDENGFLSMGPNPVPEAERTETYQINDVTTSVSDLVSGNVGTGEPAAVARFNDLADGTVFGSCVASNADNGTFIEILLNNAGVAALNANIGGLFAVGGNLTTLDTVTTNTEALFRVTNTDILTDSQLLLTITPVPEPGTWVLFGIGLLGVAARARGRSSDRRLAERQTNQVFGYIPRR